MIYIKRLDIRSTKTAIKKEKFRDLTREKFNIKGIERKYIDIMKFDLF